MINWREFPAVRILLPFLLGIYGFQFLPAPPDLSFWIFPFASVLVLLHFWKAFPHRWVFGLVASVLLLMAGYQRMYQHQELLDKQHFQYQSEQRQDTVIAWISDMPNAKKWIIAQTQVELWNECHQCTGNVLLYIENDSLSKQLQYGDRIMFSSRVDTIEGRKNPDAFDYKTYLHHKNIHHQAFIRAGQWHLLEETSGRLFWRKIYQLRTHFLDVLEQYLTTKETLGVGSALILGYRGNLSNELRNAYADTGAIHVLAVSGLHVGLIYFGLVSFLGWLPLPDNKLTNWLKMISVITGIWLFAFLAGSSASVLRAATMFSFFTVGKYIKRYKNIYNTLAAAAFSSLLYNPNFLFQVGFQMSYLAVLGIVYFQPKIVNFWTPSHWLPRYFWELLAVSFAAQLVVSPLSMYYFHQFPLWFWLSSMIVIPALFVILPLGIFLLTFSSFVAIAQVLGYILNFLIGTINSVIYAIQALPFGLVKGFWITPYEVVLLYTVLALLVLRLNTKNVRWSIVMLLSFLCYCMSYSYRAFQQVHQQEIVIYHIRKQTLIDFIIGKNCYTLQSETLTTDDADFASQQHRWARGIIQQQQTILQKDTALHTTHWFYDTPFVQFQDKRIALLYRPIQAVDTLLQLDYILLYDNPNVQISDVQAAFTFESILFDASNDWKHRKKWRKSCAELNLSCYDIAEQGAQG